jgi:hypothetical protein
LVEGFMGEKLKPISPQRVAEELKKLAADRNAGASPDIYEQRFARMIGELRDRRIDGDRATVLAVLQPLKDDGTVSENYWFHLLDSLGLN